MKKLILWLEPVTAAAALVLAGAAGLPYLAGYGNHHYACWGPILPCIVNSKADLPAGVVTVGASMTILAGLTVLAALHARLRRRLVLWLLIVLAAVYWLGFLLVEAGIFVLPYALSGACVLATCVAAIAGKVPVQGLRLKHLLVLLGGSILLWFVTSLASAVLADPIGLGPGIASGPPDAQDSLLFAMPSGRDSAGTYVGLDRFTAEDLNRIHKGVELRPLRFIGANMPSTGPDVVSVNPIDRYTWAASALSSRGICYAIVSAHDRANPKYGSTYFGRLPHGAACVGSAASPATVTGRDWPAS